MILIGRGLDFKIDFESNWWKQPCNSTANASPATAVQSRKRLWETAIAETKKQKVNQPESQLCSCQGVIKQLTISGGNDEGVTPVPIPNTEVKPFSADGT